MLELKTEGWHVRTMRELGMSDSATVHNLTKSFKDLQSSRCLVVLLDLRLHACILHDKSAMDMHLCTP